MNYVFDIDGTIFFSDYDPEENKYTLTGGNIELIKIINKLYDNGHLIILHTGRHWNHFKMTQKQLMGFNVKYHTLVMGKPVADVYVCDKSVTPENFIKEKKDAK